MICLQWPLLVATTSLLVELWSLFACNLIVASCYYHIAGYFLCYSEWYFIAAGCDVIVAVGSTPDSNFQFRKFNLQWSVVGIQWSLQEKNEPLQACSEPMPACNEINSVAFCLLQVWNGLLQVAHDVTSVYSELLQAGIGSLQADNGLVSACNDHCRKTMIWFQLKISNCKQAIDRCRLTTDHCNRTMIGCRWIMILIQQTTLHWRQVMMV